MTHADDIDVTFAQVAAAVRERGIDNYLTEVAFAGYEWAVPQAMLALHQTMHTNPHARIIGPVHFGAVKTNRRAAYTEFVEWAKAPGVSDHSPETLQAKIDTGLQFLDQYPNAVLVFAWAPAIRINN